MAKQRSSDQDGTQFAENAENAERLKDLRKRERRLLEELEENQEDEAEAQGQLGGAGARLKNFRSRGERVESGLERIRREMNEIRGIGAAPQLSEPVPAAQEAPTETAPSSATSVQEVPTGEEVAVQEPSLTEIVVETDAIHIDENLPIAEVAQEETLAETAIEEAQAAEQEEMVAEEAEAHATHVEVEAAIAEEAAEDARATHIIAEFEAVLADETAEETAELAQLAEEEATEAIA